MTELTAVVAPTVPHKVTLPLPTVIFNRFAPSMEPFAKILEAFKLVFAPRANAPL